jgi:hypothetical protein
MVQGQEFVMWDLIKDILGSASGSFAFVFALLVLSWWVVHYLTEFRTKYREEHGQFSKWIDRTESSIDKIKEDVIIIKGQIEVALALKDPYAKKRSPVSLTPLGLQMVADHGLDAMVADNWQKISSAIQKSGASNPYDIQEFCFETAFVRPNAFLSEKDFDKLKLISYQTGARLFSVARVVGILVRDRYFKENGIDVGEIDQHAPQQGRPQTRTPKE